MVRIKEVIATNGVDALASGVISGAVIILLSQGSMRPYEPNFFRGILGTIFFALALWGVWNGVFRDTKTKEEVAIRSFMYGIAALVTLWLSAAM